MLWPSPSPPSGLCAHVIRETFLNLLCLNSDFLLMSQTPVPILEPYLHFLLSTYCIFYCVLSVCSHQSVSSMRTKVFVCFLHSWFPGSLEKRGMSVLSNTLNEWSSYPCLMLFICSSDSNWRTSKMPWVVWPAHLPDLVSHGLLTPPLHWLCCVPLSPFLPSALYLVVFYLDTISASSPYSHLPGISYSSISYQFWRDLWMLGKLSLIAPQPNSIFFFFLAFISVCLPY